jgi:hypothetical protein
LGFHVTRFEPTTTLYQTVCQGGFAVVNMGNDRKISDVIHQGAASSD